MKKAVTAKRKPLSNSRPRKSGQIVATAKMLSETRSELKSNIVSLRLEMRSEFKKVDARFSKMDARFAKIDSRFLQIDSRFAQMDARFATVNEQFDTVNARLEEMNGKISEMNASIHRTLALVEEQHARNIFVLDGYTSLDARLKRLE